MRIRRMEETDLDFAVLSAAREGWTSEGREEFEAFLLHEPEGCFIAEDQTAPVGISVATSYDTDGFFGELIVAPEARGKGIGRRLLDHAVTYLRDRGTAHIYLDGVIKAVPMYERAGFRAVCPSYRMCGIAEGRDTEGVRTMRPGDLDDVCRLDRDAFGADRRFFLNWILARCPDFCKVLIQNGRIGGYVMGRCREQTVAVGPWIASPDVTRPERLLFALAEATGYRPMRIGVLGANTRSLDLLKFIGFGEENQTPPLRMVLGDKSRLGFSEQCLSIGTPAKG